MQDETTTSQDEQSIEVEVSNDGMRAFIVLPAATAFLDEKSILYAIEEAGVTEGFERAAEQAADEERLAGRPMIVALGQPVSEAAVEFSPLFDTERAFEPASFDNNLHLLQRYATVIAGEPLAHLFVTRPPRTGRNVRGEEVTPQRTADEAIAACLGEGAAFDADRSQALATSNGYPYLDETGRVCVKSEFVIEGDIGLDCEHFGVFGNLTVNGNIREKLIIEVTGNLTVNGDIDDVTVKVDGNAVINGDILNCRTGGVHVSGDISFTSADNALVVCAGHIRFTEHAQFCKLIAGRGVYGDEQKSSLVGGLVQSGEHVEVAVIGNSGAIGTEIEITISPYIKEKMLALTKKLASLREKPSDNAALIDMLTEQLQNYENQLEEHINETLLGSVTLPRHIIVFKKIFGGTYLRILKKSQTVVDEMEKVSFSIADGELVADSFKTD